MIRNEYKRCSGRKLPKDFHDIPHGDPGHAFCDWECITQMMCIIRGDDY